MNPGVNQRESAFAASHSTPSARTRAARSSHAFDPFPVSKCAEEQSTASEDTRPGWWTARWSPTAPPSDTPA